jgi:photosystem II stability/assembly factor-like uncharacterized protein
MTRWLRAIPSHAAVALAVVAVSLSAASAASSYTYPRFQPVSVAFLDEQHGVLGEDDWKCQKRDGCQGRILVTSDGGAHWRVSYEGRRGTSLYPVRGTRIVYAITGDVMIESTDAGLHWQHAAMRPVIVSFVTAMNGWRIGFTLKAVLLRPPPIEETRDGGRSWTPRVNPCPPPDYGQVAALSFASPTRGWVVCATQATAGYQGKEVWVTRDGGTHWQLVARTHPIAPPEPRLQIGNITGYGYPTGITFLADGHGWHLQDRGYMLTTLDGGHTWRNAPITVPDTVAAQSADLLTDKVGFVLLRGCAVRLVRTTDAGGHWTTLDRWNSPTDCSPSK